MTKLDAIVLLLAYAIWFYAGYKYGKYKWKPTRSNSSTFTIGSDVKSIIVQGRGGSSGGAGSPIFENELIKSNGRGPSAIELKYFEKLSGITDGKPHPDRPTFEGIGECGSLEVKWTEE